MNISPKQSDKFQWKFSVNAELGTNAFVTKSHKKRNCGAMEGGLWYHISDTKEHGFLGKNFTLDSGSVITLLLANAHAVIHSTP